MCARACVYVFVCEHAYYFLSFFVCEYVGVHVCLGECMFVVCMCVYFVSVGVHVSMRIRLHVCIRCECVLCAHACITIGCNQQVWLASEMGFTNTVKTTIYRKSLIHHYRFE